MKKRQSPTRRVTKEVNIKGKLVLDGTGKSKINTGLESLNHMLELFSFHGSFDLELLAKGDLTHHIVEDIGIALGAAFNKALGSAISIQRYGESSVPMDEVLARVSIDISGRPYFRLGKPTGLVLPNIEESMDLKSSDFETFLKAFVEHAKITMHIDTSYSTAIDTHHYFEAVFKAIAVALKKAIQIDKARKGIPSTKGVIDL